MTGGERKVNSKLCGTDIYNTEQVLLIYRFHKAFLSAVYVPGPCLSLFIYSLGQPWEFDSILEEEVGAQRS